MKRWVLILTGLLAVQCVLSIIVFWPRQARRAEGMPFLPDLEVGDVVAMTITDDSGDTVVLRKVNGAWVLPEADNFPGDAAKIEAGLEKLLSLTADNLVARSSASHKRLHVAADEFTTRVVLEDSDGVEYTLYIGSAPNYGTAYVRLAGQDETYLTAALTTWDVTSAPASWVNSSYLSIDDQVERVTLNNANGTFTFVRDATGQWVLHGLGEGETSASENISYVINKATHVTLMEPLGREEDPSYGLDEPAAVVSLKLSDRTVTLHVGPANPEDNSYVVKSSESPYYVRVAGYNIQPLVEYSRQNFVQTGATETPTP